jgi:hypothetical protein
MREEPRTRARDEEATSPAKREIDCCDLWIPLTAATVLLLHMDSHALHTDTACLHSSSFDAVHLPSM